MTIGRAGVWGLSLLRSSERPPPEAHGVPLNKNELSVAVAAHAVRMSKFYFCKQFKRGAGVNFITYSSSF